MQYKNLTTSILWTDTINSHPIDDLRYAQQFSANEIGCYGNIFKLNRNTLNMISLSKQSQDYTKKEKLDTKSLLRLMWGTSEDDLGEFFGTNNSHAVLTKCILDSQIPDGQVLIEVNNIYKILYTGF